MSRLAPPKRDPAISSDEEVLDDVPIDEFAESTLRLAASPSPAPLEADRALSEEAVTAAVARGPPPPPAVGSIYTPDGGEPPRVTATPASEDSSPASSGERRHGGVEGSGEGL